MRTSEDHVARAVGSTVCQRIDMVQRGCLEIEGGAAIHAAPTAVAHSGSLDGSFVARAPKRRVGAAVVVGGPANMGGVEDDTMTLTNGHFTSREKTTPRDGRNSHCGALNHRLVMSLAATRRTRPCRTRWTLLRECRRCVSSVGAPSVVALSNKCDAISKRARASFAFVCVGAPIRRYL